MGALNNIITMNRGDTYKFDLTIDDETSNDGCYHLTGDDALYFGIMNPGQPFETAIVRKKYTASSADAQSNLTIVLYPEDTLDLLPGKYFYAIKLHINHDEIDLKTSKPTGRRVDRVVTIINKTKFILCD